MTNAPEDIASRISALEKQVSASEQKIEDDKEKIARVAAIASSLKMAMEHMDDDKKKEMQAKIAASEDEELKAAINSIPPESFYNGPTPDENTNRSSIDGDGKTISAMKAENEKLEAKIKKMEAVVASATKSSQAEYIEQLTNYKATVVPGIDKAVYKAKLEGVPFDGIKALYEEKLDEIQALSAPKQFSAKTNRHFEFPTDSQSASEFVSLSEINGGNA